MKHALKVIFVVAGLVLVAWGCASPDAESELPWNMTQPWESSPSMPGFGGASRGY